jgi:hypothetical protein
VSRGTPDVYQRLDAVLGKQAQEPLKRMRRVPDGKKLHLRGHALLLRFIVPA